MATKASNEKTKEIRDLMIEAARLQLAGLTSVVKFWAGWAQAADKYTQAMSDEVARISEGSVESNDIVGRLSDLSREYLRDISKLPSLAFEQFNGEINKLAKSKGTRNRIVRVKE